MQGETNPRGPGATRLETWGLCSLTTAESDTSSFFFVEGPSKKCPLVFLGGKELVPWKGDRNSNDLFFPPSSPTVCGQEEWCGTAVWVFSLACHPVLTENIEENWVMHGLRENWF